MSSVTSATRHDAVLSASCFIADSLRDLYQGNRGVGVTSLGVRSKGTIISFTAWECYERTVHSSYKSSQQYLRWATVWPQ